jgi:hypothetical protein
VFVRLARMAASLDGTSGGGGVLADLRCVVKGLISVEEVSLDLMFARGKVEAQVVMDELEIRSFRVQT